MLEVGTVVHGTHRPEDLIPALMSELESRDPSGYRLFLETNQHVYLSLADDPNSNEIHEIVERLFDDLNWCAPDGYFFGAHPGDGSDFGYWPIDDEVG